MATTIDVIKPELTNDGQGSARILNFETIASYNWLDEPMPTILVPGQLSQIILYDYSMTDIHYERHSPSLEST